MINKVTDSQIAYYLGEDGNLRKINVNDAKEYLENGFKLRGRLFDVEKFDSANLSHPLKFVVRKGNQLFFSSVTSGYSKSSNCIKNEPYKDLHECAKQYLQDCEYSTLEFGSFKITNNYITDVSLEQMIDGITESDKEYINLRPDVIISTPFMDFYVEITVTNGLSDEKIALYQKFHDNKLHSMPFVVVEIDLSDLLTKSKCLGYDAVRDEVIRRLTLNTEYKNVIPMLSMNNAPFGCSVRTCKPFRLILNTNADSISVELRELIKTNSMVARYISIKSFPDDGLYSLYLTDDSAETPKIPIVCPVHNDFEHPMRLVRQSNRTEDEKEFGSPNRDNTFFKCDSHVTKNSKFNGNQDESSCSVTMTFCNKYGVLDIEFLVVDDFYSFLCKDYDSVLDRLRMLRNCYRDYRNLVLK